MSCSDSDSATLNAPRGKTSVTNRQRKQAAQSISDEGSLHSSDLGNSIEAEASENKQTDLRTKGVNLGKGKGKSTNGKGKIVESSDDSDCLSATVDSSDGGDSLDEETPNRSKKSRMSVAVPQTLGELRIFGQHYRNDKLQPVITMKTVLLLPFPQHKFLSFRASTPYSTRIHEIFF